MKENRSSKSVEPSNAKVLLGASLLGQFGGIWLATICFGFFVGSSQSLLEILFGGLSVLIFGFPFMLLAWVLVTLPMAALCLHFGINQKFFLTTLIGGVCGIPAWAVLSTMIFPSSEFRFETALGGAVYGAFTAAGFSFLSRKWGNPPEDDPSLPSVKDG